MSNLNGLSLIRKTSFILNMRLIICTGFSLLSRDFALILNYRLDYNEYL
jgi:hypothetical protein